jgi:AAHS family benzoate transporter-like MFS transporter
MLWCGIPIWMKQWGLTPAQAGVIGSMAVVGVGLGAITAGMFADKCGRKYPLIICLALFSAATGLTGFAHDIYAFGACRVLAGLGIGGSFPLAMAVMSDFAPKRNRVFMIGVMTQGMGLGGL